MSLQTFAEALQTVFGKTGTLSSSSFENRNVMLAVHFCFCLFGVFSTVGTVSRSSSRRSDSSCVVAISRWRNWLLDRQDRMADLWTEFTAESEDGESFRRTLASRLAARNMERFHIKAQRFSASRFLCFQVRSGRYFLGEHCGDWNDAWAIFTWTELYTAPSRTSLPADLYFQLRGSRHTIRFDRTKMLTHIVADVILCVGGELSDPMDVDLHDGKDRIGPMFRDRHVLITGGTGFMGKALIEKLMRCTEIGKIYLLIRIKKGKSPKQRLEDIFANPIFGKLIELRGLDTLLAQCVVIGGDVTELGLGISAEDRKLVTDNVSIIYHCAATIRFDELLKKAVMLNTRGTKLMLDLAKECKKLDMFGYVSTSYCHLNEKLLLEKPYPPPADPHKVIKAIEWLEDDVVDGITSKILGSCPNTYAYTKALGEALVIEAMKDIPAVVFRPSIVVPTWREPISGWTDNINGPVGLLIGAGKGVIRSMYCDASGYGDYLPVDFGVSAICVCTWNYVGQK